MRQKGIWVVVCVIDAILLTACIYLYMEQDRTVPVISFSDQEIRCTSASEPSLLLEGVSAYDEQDGDVSDTLLIEKISETADGNILVTYAAVDDSWNVGKASRKVFVEDQEQTEAMPAKHAEESEKENEAGMPSDVKDEVSEQDVESGLTGEKESDHEDSQIQQGRAENSSREVNRQENRNESGNTDQQRTDAGSGRGKAENPVGQISENEAPILTLKSDRLSVNAGVESVDWYGCIAQLSDDKDDAALLFANISMEGYAELSVPGDYPVIIYTKDSEGLESERKTVHIHVE